MEMNTKNWFYKKYLSLPKCKIAIILFFEVEVKFEAQVGAYMVLIFLAILLVVLIEVVLIKKACTAKIYLNGLAT